ncbi:MAG: dihydrofolate reductase [Bacteroidales bacterium]|nr:dihydrofolate reductase [Bacteroidales bacterium]
MTEKRPLISFIVAIAQNGAIGKDNRLPWHIPADLKRFKKITTGHTVVMGKQTLHSLPAGPLPNRRNIVLSRTLESCCDGRCELARSMDDVLRMTKGEEEVFIIGGAIVFRQYLPIADKLYLTIVEADIEADTFFDEIDFGAYQLVEQERIGYDSAVGFSYRYETWERKQDN